MRKTLNLVLTLALSLALAQLPSLAGKKKGGKRGVKLASVGSVSAVVSGKVQLLAKAKKFPSDLEDIYAGREGSVNTSKKGKVVEVTGNYDGSGTVTVDEKGSFTDAQGRYKFEFPAVRSVMASLAKKAKASSKHGVAKLNFFNKLDSSSGGGDDNNDSGSGSTPSVGSVIGIFNTPINFNKEMSIKKIVASKKGDKGKLKGIFYRKGTSAKGRFVLNFDF